MGKAFATALRTYRNSVGITQAGLAGLTNGEVSESLIANAETGRRLMSREKIAILIESVGSGPGDRDALLAAATQDRRTENAPTLALIAGEIDRLIDERHVLEQEVEYDGEPPNVDVIMSEALRDDLQMIQSQIDSKRTRDGRNRQPRRWKQLDVGARTGPSKGTSSQILMRIHLQRARWKSRLCSWRRCRGSWRRCRWRIVRWLSR